MVYYHLNPRRTLAAISHTHRSRLGLAYLGNVGGAASSDPRDLAGIAHPLHKVVQAVHHVGWVGQQEHLAGKQAGAASDQQGSRMSEAAIEFMGVR